MTAASGVLLAMPACGGDSPSEGLSTDLRTTVEAPATTGVVAERSSRPHPPLRESSLRLARRLTEDSRPDERLTAVAVAQLPADVKVWCWEAVAWDELQDRMNNELRPSERGEFSGIVDHYAFAIHLAPWVCKTLADSDFAGDSLSTAEAELARIAWEDVYATSLPEYRSDQCRPGGALGNDPSTPEFP